MIIRPIQFLQISSYANKRSARVIQIAITKDTVRSIITENGELFVSGVRVSSYSLTSKLHLSCCLVKLQKIISRQIAQRVENKLVDEIDVLARYMA